MREAKNSYKMLIPLAIKNKLDTICLKLSNKEWSGVLFYTVSGSLLENNLLIKMVDFYPLDIGTGVFTEYEENEDLLNYMIEHDLMGEDIYRGNIHSHNVMETFFSDTDMDTLNSEATEYPHFLSLIVNNVGKYNAKITTIQEIKSVGTTTRTYTTFDGTQHSITEDLKQTFKKIIVNPIVISIENDALSDEIDNVLNLITKRKKEFIQKNKKENLNSIKNPYKKVIKKQSIKSYFTELIKNDDYGAEVLYKEIIDCGLDDTIGKMLTYFKPWTKCVTDNKTHLIEIINSFNAKVFTHDSLEDFKQNSLMEFEDLVPEFAEEIRLINPELFYHLTSDCNGENIIAYCIIKRILEIYENKEINNPFIIAFLKMLEFKY